MTEFYSRHHRELQATFGSKPLADRLEMAAVRDHLNDADQAFVAARDMFFLSSVDDEGFPTVSYKGGEAGFVRVIDKTTLAFPSYDGNGMFLSMGNITGNSAIGLLFIDLEKPRRLRIQGHAFIDPADPLLTEYAEAQLIVRVMISRVWPNCPRYIHRYTKQLDAPHIPRHGIETPMPDWKRIDGFQDVLSEVDRAAIQVSGGTITAAEYASRLLNPEG